MLGVLLLVGLWLVSSIWGIAGKARIAVSEAEQARGQYASLEERKAKLAANLAELDTSRGKDAAIRTTFGVAKAGEEVIVVVPPAPSPSPSRLPWWRRVLHWF